MQSRFAIMRIKFVETSFVIGVTSVIEIMFFVVFDKTKLLENVTLLHF